MGVSVGGWWCGCSLNNHRVGWPSRPEGRLGREATRGSFIRDQLFGDRYICNDGEVHVFTPIETAQPGLLSLREPPGASHADGQRKVFLTLPLVDAPCEFPPSGWVSIRALIRGTLVGCDLIFAHEINYRKACPRD